MDHQVLLIHLRDIPVDFKYIADPSMHSMPYVRLSPNERYLAFQSMDNQIKIMEPTANFRWKNKKVFRGHMVNAQLDLNKKLSTIPFCQIHNFYI